MADNAFVTPERSLWIDVSGGGRLMGVITRSVVEETCCPVFVFLNAGWVHRIGPNRIYVGLARRLGACGFHSFRFDFSWIGDSAPRTDGLPMRRAVVDETRSVLDALSKELGATSFILVGLCSGADAAFRVALEDERVVGAVFIDGFPYRNLGWYWQHYIPRLFRNPRRLMRSVLRFVVRGSQLWDGGGRQGTPQIGRDVPTRSEAAQGLQELVDREVRLCVLFTEGQLDWYNHPGQFESIFRGVSFGGLARISFLDRTDHVFTLRASRQRLEDTISTWAKQWWVSE